MKHFGIRVLFSDTDDCLVAQNLHTVSRGWWKCCSYNIHCMVDSCYLSSSILSHRNVSILSCPCQHYRILSYFHVPCSAGMVDSCCLSSSILSHRKVSILSCPCQHYRILSCFHVPCSACMVDSCCLSSNIPSHRILSILLCPWQDCRILSFFHVPCNAGRVYKWNDHQCLNRWRSAYMVCIQWIHGMKHLCHIQHWHHFLDYS